MLPVAVTMGEPGGIGGEIVLEAWLRLRSGPARFFSIDDPGRLARLASGRAAIVEISGPEEVSEVFPGALPVLCESLTGPAPPGVASSRNAGVVIRSIERAVSLALDRRAGAVVTSPIDKAALRKGAGFRHSGHTEFLGELAGQADAPVMMLVSGSLRVIPVTIHIPLREVADLLRAEDIVHAGKIAFDALRTHFGIPAPRLAVSGLNPHAGEDGMLGFEEERVVRPALDVLRSLGVDASGPYPADSMFRQEFRQKFDAAICMYHDQALIPVKALGFPEAVNVTLGLPFVRTSPGHGVAYDLAGTGRATPDSLVAAIRLAARLSEARPAA